ncbi:MAG: hypothetical protein ACXVBJ_14140, partial [Flavisolibacter sp.]
LKAAYGVRINKLLELYLSNTKVYSFRHLIHLALPTNPAKHSPKVWPHLNLLAVEGTYSFILKQSK